jgi:uncharacterized Ntn-hydrolase superfamily protein
MMRARRILTTAILLIALWAPLAPAQTTHPPVATFSIVARDPGTGEMGVAVQSKYFSVGHVVPWGEAGVGVVATQANVNAGYGLQGLDLLRQGLSAEEVKDRLLAEDTFPGVEGRQFAVVDANGGIAVHTGPTANFWAGHRVGEHYSAQGNILTGPEVVEAMGDAFEAAGGTLAEKMQAAMVAGQEAGGDSRGRQSSAMLVVGKGMGRNINNDVVARLQVEDHPMPIQELGRVLNINLAITAMSRSRERNEAGDSAAALAAAEKAAEFWPDASDTWLNLGLLNYSLGNRDRALEVLGKAASMNELFRGQLESTLSWTRHPGLDDEFLAELFPGGS